MKKVFIKRDDRLYYPYKPTWGLRWRIVGLFEGYFLLSPKFKLEPFLKLISSSPPKRGLGFSFGFLGAGIRRHLNGEILGQGNVK